MSEDKYEIIYSKDFGIEYYNEHITYGKSVYLIKESQAYVIYMSISERSKPSRKRILAAHKDRVLAIEAIVKLCEIYEVKKIDIENMGIEIGD